MSKALFIVLSNFIFINLTKIPRFLNCIIVKFAFIKLCNIFILKKIRTDNVSRPYGLDLVQVPLETLLQQLQRWSAPGRIMWIPWSLQYALYEETGLRFVIVQPHASVHSMFLESPTVKHINADLLLVRLCKVAAQMRWK